MSLKDYRRKRRFDQTAEPSSGSSSRKTRPHAIFVVQLHHARRRHYDFRLQVGRVLKSWAVPKGPSLDPAVKRLAVEVEDHPLAYAQFAGEIPEGQYGAGVVELFDRGLWTTDANKSAQLAKGHLHFELHGKKLRGGWHLVRSGRKVTRERQPTWFLIKASDEFANKSEADDFLEHDKPPAQRRPARARRTGGSKTKRERHTRRSHSVPVRRAALTKLAAAAKDARAESIRSGFFKPELATPRSSPPDGAGWLHEIKWDGYRLLTTVAQGDVRLWSRNGVLWNRKLPQIVKAIKDLGLRSARLDGELIAVVDTRSDFGALQEALSGENHAPLSYVLFDLLHLEGQNLERTPLIKRKELLRKLLQRAPAALAYSSHSEGNGKEAFRVACEDKLEGIISKRAAAPYRAGRRDDWVKVKRLEADEFAVIGYTPARGSRTGFGALLLATPERGQSWRYRGRVGSGFTDSQLRELAANLATNGKRKPPVRLYGIDPLLRGALWIEPRVVVEVYYRGFGNHGLLRQPTFKGLRVDKQPADLVASGHAPAAQARPRRRRSAAHPQPSDGAIVITHPERVVFPHDGITKQQVADYYSAVMDWLLPGVVNRPVSIIRCPEGIGKACFFQKHGLAGLQQTREADLSEESGTRAAYIYVDSAAAVLELVQFGALEFHPWGATVAEPERADRVVFDLDPGPAVPWKRVIAAARLVRKLLAQLELQSFVRTTGGKGLHVVVPLHPAGPWADVKAFARGFAETLAQSQPRQFVAVANKAERRHHIYVDYLRNSRGATSVASYSLRAREGAPVAMPIRWEELGKLRSSHTYTLHSAPKRLARLRKDSWDGFDSLRQSLAGAYRNLGWNAPKA